MIIFRSVIVYIIGRTGKRVKNFYNTNMDEENIDWKILLMKILHCIGEVEGDWHEEYWRRFGISIEEGRAIVKQYEKFNNL